MRYLRYIILFICSGLAFAGNAQTPFTAGNIVVYRIGDGSAPMDFNCSRVYLDEYTPTGTLVQSIQMPDVENGSNKRLTAAGAESGMGLLSLSANGKYLVVPGMDAEIGTSGTTATASVIGLVDFNGTINTSTAVPYPESSNKTFSATSDDGNRIWFCGADVIRYTTLGSNTSIPITVSTGSAMQALNITDGQLYSSNSSSSSASVFAVGAGLPVTGGQTMTALPGLGAFPSTQQFAFADLDPNIPGVDVLYLASQQGSTTLGGIKKYSLVAGSWVANGVVSTGSVSADRYQGLTIKVSGNAVTIFWTRRGGNSTTVRGGQLVSLTDNAGYNGTLTGTPTVLVSVANANSMSFRGVALVPQPAPFTPGNIVVYRLGDGNTQLDGNAAKVFLDEYTPAGTLIQSIQMPATASGTNNILTAAGTEPGMGLLSLSADGKFLVVPGVNAAEGNAVSSATASVIGLVDFNAKINTSTAPAYPEASNKVFSATSDDGTNIWFSGYDVIRYTTAGSTTSLPVSNPTGGNLISLSIADGQLYNSNAQSSSSVYAVGTGLPTTGGNALTVLPGMSLPLSAQQFAFADLDPNIPGVDVLYLASQQGSTTLGGIKKFSLVGGTWIANGVVSTGSVSADRYQGLAIRVSGNIVTLFWTRRGPNSTTVRGGQLVTLIDNSGYNGQLTGTPAILATVSNPNTMSFRGVARVPVGCPPVTALRIPDVSATQANVFWNANGGGNFEYAVTTSPAPPASGSFTTNNFINLSGLTNTTDYYVHVRTACTASGNSEWASASFTTGCKAPPLPLVNIAISNAGVVVGKWNKVFGAASYEYAITESSTLPVSGTAITDSFVTLTGLNSVTQYYLHVRSDCGSGVFSGWTTKPFKTGCFTTAPTLSFLANNAGVKWNQVANAVKYEYVLSNSPVAPTGGHSTIDTTYTTTGKLTEGGAYYFHVRAICTGGVSEWSTLLLNVQGLQVYPNPVKDMLIIQLNGIVNPSSGIIIGDATGRLITRMKLSGNTVTINTRSWATGIYLVRYDDGKNKYSVKIIKQ